MSRKFAYGSFAALAAIAVLTCGSAQAQQLAFSAPVQSRVAPAHANFDADIGNVDATLAPRLQRQVVDYPSREAAGTIIVDTAHTYLYLVLGHGKALRYGIGVGREGFTWSGVKSVQRKAEWPDWFPPAEMIARQPYLPRMTAGGPGNPLGARALYIGGTVYRIHGTNDPTTIGKNVSSGCIRLTNDDVIDLFNRVQVGAKVIVLPQACAPLREAKGPAPRERMTFNAARAPALY
ncbi:MAG TPA: L,D-transpeptidase [Pseudolabrys sp.]|nr:L,D-transpeptidase [Pseudolabrys sp.]